METKILAPVIDQAPLANVDRSEARARTPASPPAAPVQLQVY